MFCKCFLKIFLEKEKVTRENEERENDKRVKVINENVINHIFFKFVFLKKKFIKPLKTIFYSLNFLFTLNLFLKTVLRE